MVRGATLAVLVAGAALLASLAGCTSSSEGAGRATTTGASGTSTPQDTTTTEPTARASAGCGSEPAVHGLSSDLPGDVPLTLESGGTERSYRLSVPDSYDPDQPSPLVLNLHGARSNALQTSVYSDLPRQAARRGVIVVAPDAIDGFWQLAAGGTDDDFLMALVGEVSDGYCVDLDRVHVVGISLGAFKASQMACSHPDTFASLSLVAEEVRPGDCAPMPVIAFHGTADHVVPYGEGADPGVVVTGPNAGLPGARVNIASWAEGGGCSATRSTEPVGEDVERWTHPGCDPGVDVELYTILHGGHTWPGADIEIGPTTQTIDATELTLDFFEAHPLTRGS